MQTTSKSLEFGQLLRSTAAAISEAEAPLAEVRVLNCYNYKKEQIFLSSFASCLSSIYVSNWTFLSEEFKIESKLEHIFIIT